MNNSLEAIHMTPQEFADATLLAHLETINKHPLDPSECSVDDDAVWGTIKWTQMKIDLKP